MNRGTDRLPDERVPRRRPARAHRRRRCRDDPAARNGNGDAATARPPRRWPSTRCRCSASPTRRPRSGSSIDGKVRLDELICDGVMVATPAGSTAYNLSAHGPILPLDAPLLALTPVSPFRPRRWRGALMSNRSTVRFDMLEPDKRPVNAVGRPHRGEVGDFGHACANRRRRPRRCCSTPAIPGTNASWPSSSATDRVANPAADQR